MTEIAPVTGGEWYADVPRSIRKQAVFGLVLMIAAFGGFGWWSFSAPLAAAVIAQGSFVATGRNKVVQHLEGGIIDRIRVSEGDRVRAGDVIVALDRTAAQATERELKLRQARLEAMEARLLSEYEGRTKLIFPADLAALREDGEVASILDGQALAFRVARASLDNDLRLMQRDIEALTIRGRGYEAQLGSYREQLELLRSEYTAKDRLFRQGLARRSEVSSLQRAMVDAEGQLGRIEAEIEEISEIRRKYEAQIKRTIDAHRQTALDELQSIQGELDSIRERSRAAQNVASRVDVASPVDGTVVRLYYHTAGGVIEPGKAIAEILPADAPLIVETQIPRTDIDSVRRGEAATVRLSALNRRTTPVLEGTVEYVSADSVRDTTGPVAEVYVVRVSLTAAELARVGAFQPSPGMPAEVMIQTQSRTFIQYLVKPITDSMSRAFREE